MRFAGGGYGVRPVEHGGGAGGAFDATCTGLDHLALAVATYDGSFAWAEHLTAAGVEHSGISEIPPGAILNSRDDDGIALALFWDRDTR